MTDKMEMPDVMYIETEQREFAFEEGEDFINKWDVEKYHHDRIVEALKAENEQLRNDYGSMGVTLAARNSEIEELKAKLDKAKDGINELVESLSFCVKKIEKINGECNATYISKQKLKKYAPEQH